MYVPQAREIVTVPAADFFLISIVFPFTLLTTLI